MALKNVPRTTGPTRPVPASAHPTAKWPGATLERLNRLPRILFFVMFVALAGMQAILAAWFLFQYRTGQPMSPNGLAVFVATALLFTSGGTLLGGVFLLAFIRNRLERIDVMTSTV